MVGGFLFFLFYKNKNASAEKESQIINKNNKNMENNSKNKKIAAKKSIKIIFAGDLMFDRYIRQIAQKKGNDFIFQGLTDYLNSADLVVANLEGPITDNKSKSIGSEFKSHDNFVFTFDSNLAPTLAKQNIKAVNLGNNHILNFGKEGLQQTVKYLDKEGIKYFGDTGGESFCQPYLETEVNGINLGLVNYSRFAKNSAEQALNNIKKLTKEVDFLAVYTHWGQEYKTEQNESQEILAHRFVDAGADAVIGSHPHVIQGQEVYKGKPVYYSLGNFVFDQYFSANTKKGLLVEFEINKEGSLKNIKDTELNLKNNGQAELVTIND